MRYLGSKATITANILEVIGARPGGHFCDPFAGIGTVASAAKRRGMRVTCGDVLTFPHYFQIARVCHARMPTFARLRAAQGFRTPAECIAHLNAPAVRREGWLFRNYAARRRFFTRANARHIDGAWEEIRGWNAAGLLSDRERAFLLASLVESADRVANTAGTYYAYLKSWTAKAHKPFELRPVAPTPGPRATAVLGEAAEVAERHGKGILYLDPPYNRRCYARYYHLPETLARLETPPLHGKSGMPLVARPVSRFTSPAQAHAALAELLERSSAPTVVFHYARDGLIDLEDARSLLARLGDVADHALAAPGYTTRAGVRRVTHTLLVMRRG